MYLNLPDALCNKGDNGQNKPNVLSTSTKRNKTYEASYNKDTKNSDIEGSHTSDSKGPDSTKDARNNSMDIETKKLKKNKNDAKNRNDNLVCLTERVLVKCGIMNNRNTDINNDDRFHMGNRNR